MRFAYNDSMRKSDNRPGYGSRYGEGLNPYLKRISNLLIELNITPSYLSKVAGLGTSTLSNLLKRNNVPTIASLDRICAALGIRLSSFVKEVEDENPEMFVSVRADTKRIDFLVERKRRIVDAWSDLPENDRSETLKRMIEEYSSLEKEEEGDDENR